MSKAMNEAIRAGFGKGVPAPEEKKKLGEKAVEDMSVAELIREIGVSAERIVEVEGELAARLQKAEEDGDGPGRGPGPRDEEA